MPEPVTVVGLAGGLAGLGVHFARRQFETAKEVMDIVLAAVLAVLAAPLLLCCVMIIKFYSRGPAFFTQVRVGKGGKLFRIYKLRTMRVGAERKTGPVWASGNDRRVISVCKWMRRSHVDELPQLLNVLKGEMSLVGPRPERPEIMDKLRIFYPDIDKRLIVRPGITGLAQIRRGYDTDAGNFYKKLRADMEYIGNRCWSMELSIMLKTLGKLRDKTAH